MEPKRKTIKVPDDSYCLKCVWANKQTEGNVILCVLPGECFWLRDWR